MPRRSNTYLTKREIRHIKKSRVKNRRYTIYGKMFRTKSGKYGAYKYHNGRRVAFVEKRNMR